MTEMRDVFQDQFYLLHIVNKLCYVHRPRERHLWVALYLYHCSCISRRSSSHIQRLAFSRFTTTSENIVTGYYKLAVHSTLWGSLITVATQLALASTRKLTDCLGKNPQEKDSLYRQSSLQVSKNLFTVIHCQMKHHHQMKYLPYIFPQYCYFTPMKITLISYLQHPAN
jgi:hypothetical protein